MLDGGKVDIAGVGPTTGKDTAFFRVTALRLIGATGGGATDGAAFVVTTLTSDAAVFDTLGAAVTAAEAAGAEAATAGAAEAAGAEVATAGAVALTNGTIRSACLDVSNTIRYTSSGTLRVSCVAKFRAFRKSPDSA